MHYPQTEVVYVVSSASLNGLWSFLQETVHPVAVVAYGLRLCGGERARADALSVLPKFRGLELSVPIPARWEARLFRRLARIRHAQTQRIQGNTTRLLSFSLPAQVPSCRLRIQILRQATETRSRVR